MLCADRWYAHTTNSNNNKTQQVEKVSHATARELLASFGEVTQVGVSLGSFSLSGPILVALLDEVNMDIHATI